MASLTSKHQYNAYSYNQEQLPIIYRQLGPTIRTDDCIRQQCLANELSASNNPGSND